MMQDDDISDLLSRYEQMLVSGKNVYFDADEYDILAEYYDKLDDIETSKEIVNLGLRIHPNNESLMLRHARFMIYDANYATALEFLTSNFSSYDFELYLLKIECFLQLKLYAEAYQLTAKVLEDEDTDPGEILSELGFLYIEAEYFNEAILYFEKSLNYESENIEVLYDLIYAYEAIEDFKSAIDTCEKILDIDPYVLDGWLMLGKLYSLEENYEKAIDAFDFALTLDDDNINVIKLKSHCLILSERFTEAIEMLKQSIEIDDEDEKSHIALIDCYMNVEQYENMLNHIQKYESQFGENEDSLIRKAYAYFLKNRLEDAEFSIKQVLNTTVATDILNTIAGDLYLKMEKYTEAEPFYQKALELSSESSKENILEKLITFYIKKGDLLNAIKYHKRLLELTDSAISQEKLALLYLEIGDKENFNTYVNSLSDNILCSFFNIFYPEEKQNIKNFNRNYILERLDQIYESRLLYKNIKY